MQQSRIESLIEAVINTAIGFVVALASQIAVFPMFGIHVPFSANLGIGAWFTVISVLRSYVVRRYFNAKIRKFSIDVAGGSDGN